MYPFKTVKFKMLTFFLNHPSVKALLLTGLYFLCTMNSAMAAQLAGTVERFVGEVRISGSSGERVAAAKSEINEGEKIATSSGAEAVVKMVDGALLAIRPNSQILINTYRFSKDPKKAKEDSSIVQLLQGGLRAVTGLIGKQNPAGVQYRTVTATVGIRGTDFELVLLEEDTAEATAGTYSRVFEGQTYIESIDARQVEVSVNQAAYAPRDVTNPARQFGLLDKVPNKVFSTGKFDDILQSLQQEDLQRLQTERSNTSLPFQFQLILPGLGNLFKQEKSIPAPTRSGGATRTQTPPRTDAAGRPDSP